MVKSFEVLGSISAKPTVLQLHTHGMPYCATIYLKPTPTPQAMPDMQGTYQYWGARFFSFMHIGTETSYTFQMRVDDAARLWINNTLVIDATCTSFTHSKLHLLSHSKLFGSTTRHPDDLTTCLCLLLCIRDLTRTRYYSYFHSAGTQTGTQSSANSNNLWDGSIYLKAADVNVTIEYHNGNGGGVLTFGGDFTSSTSRAVSAC